MQMIGSFPRPGWSLLASQRPSSTRSSSRRLLLRPAAQANNGSDNERNNYNVRKGKQFENKRRRRGRPAHLRSPYDSPLRDGNRDRLIGLLTERAAKTLMVYLMETNANVYSWLVEFYKANPIPKNGNWDEVSGEAFLRKLLSMPIEEAKFNTGRDSLFDNVRSCGVDPRSIAQRIMDIRTQLSEEFIQELQAIAEENSVLLRETLQTSLSSSLPTLDDPAAAAAGSSDAPVHPELAETTSSSSSSAATEDKGRKSSSSKDGSVSTPPPSPVPDTPAPKAEPIKGASSSSSSKASSDAADKAAAVAALNAALNKPPAAGSGSGSSSTSSSSSSSSSSEEEKVDMSEVLAQLRRAMEADVARDVLKMKETTAAPESPPGSDGSSSAATAASSGEQQQEAADAPSIPEAAGDSLNPTTGAAAVEEAPAQEEQVSTPTLAPAAEAAATAADGAQADADAEAAAGSAEAAAGGQGPSGSALVGEAGTYSLMLPKGWGPRLGVGFSRYPRSRNNIVSSASLGSLKPGAAAAGDALSGAAGEAV